MEKQLDFRKHFFSRTASPHAFIVTCAVSHLEVDPKSLFAEAVAPPPSFRFGQFLYASPKQFSHELPSRGVHEVAFFGRSNVGKSSLINALTRKKLARTSKTPGRTQQVNYFALTPKKGVMENATGYIVDLPGYGYAKAPDQKVSAWQKKHPGFSDRETKHWRLEENVSLDRFACFGHES